MVTDDRLTARSADVQTLLNRNVIVKHKKAVVAISTAAALTLVGMLYAQAPNAAGANASKNRRMTWSSIGSPGMR